MDGVPYLDISRTGAGPVVGRMWVWARARISLLVGVWTGFHYFSSRPGAGPKLGEALDQGMVRECLCMFQYVIWSYVCVWRVRPKDRGLRETDLYTERGSMPGGTLCQAGHDDGRGPMSGEAQCSGRGPNMWLCAQNYVWHVWINRYVWYVVGWGTH